jgi:hypothetical protein
MIAIQSGQQLWIFLLCYIQRPTTGAKVEYFLLVIHRFKKKNKTHFPESGQEIRCQEVISSEMKAQNAKGPERKQSDVIFFPCVCRWTGKL